MIPVADQLAFLFFAAIMAAVIGALSFTEPKDGRRASRYIKKTIRSLRGYID